MDNRVNSEELINQNKQLKTVVKRLEDVIKGSDLGTWVWYIKEDTFFSNNILTTMLGYDNKEFPNKREERFQLIHFDDLKRLEAQLDKIFKNENKQYDLELRMKHKDGRWLWVHDLAQVVSWSDDGKPLVMAGTHQNISKRIKMKNELTQSEKKYRQLVDNMPLGLVLHRIILDENDNPVDYTFISANKKYEDQTGIKISEVYGKSILDVHPDTEQIWIENFGRVALTGVSSTFDQYSKELHKHFKVSVFSPEKYIFAVIVEDITVEKAKQIEIEYLSNHDYLSGLYNRRYFVSKFNELDNPKHYPLAVMMLDVNGLKIINDAFGHKVGDRTIKITSDALTSSFYDYHIVCRIGGDEFAVIMPNTSFGEIEKIKINLFENLKTFKINNLTISLATGYETKINGSDESLDDLLKQAENHMYRHKIAEGASIRNNAIKAILKTLSEKYEEEGIHSEKVSDYCYAIGKELKLNNEELNILTMAGLFHDVGKISLPDAILYKPGRLTDEEYAIVKTHPEVSYKILRAADEYTDIANYALYHHERWDGLGYPSGKKGREIPLFSRIICVADSYEAMTSERPYKDCMSVDEAVKEIIRCSGTQFDKKIAKIFVKKVLGKEWS